MRINKAKNEWFAGRQLNKCNNNQNSYLNGNLRFYLINAVYLIEAELKTFNSIHQIENNRIWLNRKLTKTYKIIKKIA